MKLYVYRMNFTHNMASCLNNAQRMHQLLTCLAGCGREEANLLYKADPEHALLFVQSDRELKKCSDLSLIKAFDVSKYFGNVKDGQEFTFLWTTDPRKHIRQGARRYRYLTDAEEQNDWVKRTLDKNGFTATMIQPVRKSDSYFSHADKEKGSASLTFYEFKIHGKVKDADAFRHAWQTGVGMHKAYGNGLMLAVK